MISRRHQICRITMHCRRRMRCATAIALLAFGLGPIAASAAPHSGVPSDTELERNGAVIGSIEIDNQDVFDVSDPREDRALYRLSNRLHIETRRDLIERQLLFRTDDPYSRRLLDESARNLRAERFFYNAEVVPVRFSDGRVDVRVTTRDVWSLNPGVSFSRRGGRSAYGIEFEELNLLGRGVSLGIAHKSGIDRDIRRIDFADRHLLGERLELLAGYANNSDGNEMRFGLTRPFYALDARWSAGINLERIERVNPLYRLGVIDSSHNEQLRRFDVLAGWSSGLHSGWARRWLVGYTRDQHEFAALPGAVGDMPLPQNRDLAYPWIGFELVQDDFSIASNRDQIGRTEDVLLGARIEGRLGYSSAAHRTEPGALIYHASFDRGFALTPRATLSLSSTLDGRMEQGAARDLWSESNARFHFRQSERWLLFAEFGASWTHALDLDHQLLLGGDNGLRGYPLRYQSGERSARFTVEQRFFSDWYPFRLFRVGAAAFFDAGRTFGDDALDTPNYGLLRDVGVGLRLGNSRSGLGNIIHVDLAFPLDGPDDLRAMQFLIETRKEF